MTWGADAFSVVEPGFGGFCAWPLGGDGEHGGGGEDGGGDGEAEAHAPTTPTGTARLATSRSGPSSH